MTMGLSAILGMGILVKVIRDLTDAGPLTLGIPGKHWLAWHLPVWRAVTRRRGYAQAFALIADSLEAGHTLPATIEKAADAIDNNVWRNQLTAWRNHINAGMAVEQAATAAGLPPLVVGLVATGQASGNLHEVLRFLSRYYGERFSRVQELLRAGIMPLIVIALAVVIGAFIIAMFLPLVELIEAVTPNVW